MTKVAVVNYITGAQISVDGGVMTGV